jgi:hypothetical protein
VSTSGPGYQGTRKDDKGLDVASWRLPQLAARDTQTFSITLSSGAPPSGTVSWLRPGQRKGAASDTVNIAMPPRPPAE